ncbi:glycosyltransferase family 4 protein [Pedobacter psychroterrae]|uniref:Glycosyltransferase n=1 Tax=Pedobacter psychroterrae TaxID=2530453 RepID=A0A4R0NRP6_9SPHI|nr:glycosyltransferase family 4 protein [Pedobacter psychroterrae]TCD03791.1 glycosyltransferase [Pedobacter psychroterrae]
MEILFVSHKYPPATGGMERQSFELISQMALLTKVHHIIYEGQESRFRFFSQLGKRIRRIVEDNPGISIIHFNDGLMGAFSMFHRRHKNLKIAVTLHGLDVVFPGIIYQKFIFPKFNDFDLIFAVSSATASACKARGIAAEKIVVVNNGVDAGIRANISRTQVDALLSQRYQADIAGKSVLVAIGRPVKRKGFSWFIKNILPLLHKDVILLLIGPVQDKESGLSRLLKFLPAFISRRIELFLGAPGDETDLRKLLKKTNEKSRVIRMGKLPQDDIDAILGIADAFIMPNIEVQGDMEGFGLVCLEACMRGTKVFASASGGITDAIIHGSNGILLPPGHIASWVNALNQTVGTPDSQLSTQEIISFTSNRFGWQKMAEAYFLHFKNL